MLSKKALIDRYRSITIELVKGIRNQESKHWQRKDPLAPVDVLSIITGFGFKSPDTEYRDHETYEAIYNAQSDEELLSAIKARADFLEEMLNNEINKEST